MRALHFTIFHVLSVVCVLHTSLGSSTSTSPAPTISRTTPTPANTSTTLRTTPKPCPRLTPPVNGLVTVAGYTHGYYARYECNPGFELHGVLYRQCILGSWTGDTPICYKLKPLCPTLTAPQHGSINLLSRKVGGWAFFHCDVGWEIRSTDKSNLQCKGTSTWDGPIPTCVAKTGHVTCVNKRNDCDALGLQGGCLFDDIQLDCPQTCKVQCDKILTIKPTPTTVKSSTVPTTVPTTVKSPTVLTPNPITSTTSSLAVPTTSVATTASSTSTSPSVRYCSMPSAPQNGGFIFSSNAVGSYLTFICNPGYFLQGPSKVRCSAQNQWLSVEKVRCSPRGSVIASTTTTKTSTTTTKSTSTTAVGTTTASKPSTTHAGCKDDFTTCLIAINRIGCTGDVNIYCKKSCNIC